MQPDYSFLQAKTCSYWFYFKIYVVFDGCIYWFIIYKHKGMSHRIINTMSTQAHHFLRPKAR